MKISRGNLRKLILEVLNENARKLTIRGQDFSEPGQGIPLEYDPTGEYTEKIKILILNDDPQSKDHALALLGSLGLTEEEALAYYRKVRAYKHVQDDPAYYSSQLSASDIEISLNNLFPEDFISVTVRPYSWYAGETISNANYDVLIMLNVNLGKIVENNEETGRKRSWDLEPFKPNSTYFDYHKSQDALTTEQQNMIEQAKQKLESTIEKNGYVLTEPPINYAIGETLQHPWNTNARSYNLDELEFTRTYEIKSNSNLPIEIK